MTTLQAHLRKAADRLRRLPTPDLDAELLLSFVSHQSREQLLSSDQQSLSLHLQKNYDRLLDRREQGEPVAYLTGVREFYGRKFFVDRSVLIPRQETEELIDLVRELVHIRHHTIVDVGTGCGNIAITLKHLFQQKRVIGCDVSPSALQTAERNRRNQLVELELFQGDLLQPLIERSIHASIIVANLPYLDPQYPQNPSLRFEPPYALFAPRGLSQILRLLSQIGGLASRPEILMFETDPRNENGKIQHPFYEQEIKKDLAGLDRFVILNLKQS